MIREQLLDPILGRKAQIFVQTVTHIVTVQQITVMAHAQQSALQFVGKGGFTSPRQAGEPDNAGPLPLLLAALCATHCMRVPDQISGFLEAADGCHAIPSVESSVQLPAGLGLL